MQKRIFDKLIAAVLVFSVIWCVILPIGLKKHLNHWFFEVHAPAYGCLSLCKNLQNFWALRSESKITLINYCRDLARENALLKLKIAENTQNIACLKKSYEPPLYEEFRYLPARVCKRQFDSWAQLLIVNRQKRWRGRRSRGYLLPRDRWTYCRSAFCLLNRGTRVTP